MLHFDLVTRFAMSKAPRLVEVAGGGNGKVGGWKSVGLGAGFSVGVREGGGVWCWGDNSMGQLGVGLTRRTSGDESNSSSSSNSNSIQTKKVTAVSGRRLRCVQLVSQLSSAAASDAAAATASSHATDYFLHFADGRSSWTSSSSISRHMLRWLSCSEQLVAAMAAVQQSEAMRCNDTSLLPSSPSPQSPSAAAIPHLKLSCVSFSLQHYLHNTCAQVVAWTMCLAGDWIHCDVSSSSLSSATAAATAATAAAMSLTSTQPLVYGGPASPRLHAPPFLAPSSLLLTPSRSSVPLRVCFADSPTSSLSPIPVAPSPEIHSPLLCVPDALEIKSVSCGMRHTIAVDAVGRVWTWGCNADGQASACVHIACFSAEKRSALTIIHTNSPFSTLHVQLGLGLPQTPDCCVEYPHQVTHYVSTSASSTSSSSSSSSSSLPSRPPVAFLPLPPISSVACGDAHTAAVSRDFSCAFTWGAGAHGQLGLGSESSANTPFRTLHSPPLSILAAACGSCHTLFLVSNGRFSFALECGATPFAVAPAAVAVDPVQVTYHGSTLTDISKVYAGGSRSAAALENGRLLVRTLLAMCRHISVHCSTGLGALAPLSATRRTVWRRGERADVCGCGTGRRRVVRCGVSVNPHKLIPRR
jgi:alpha-tubulin suppressor-like RCC1 family protein